jgi:cytidylate kinase
MPASYEEVLADMIKRDEQDRSRDVAPAIAAPDAIHFDNSYDGFGEALDALLAVIQNTLTEKGITYEQA